MDAAEERLGAAAEATAAEAAHTRPDGGDAAESVIRITAAGKERHYISYATGLLDRGERLTAGLGAASCAHGPGCARNVRARVARAPTTSPNHALATLRERGQVNTERYRETMKKEERITAGRNSSMARQSLDMLTERRRESAGAKADALDKMVADRSYKPTSQALSIGTKLEMASSCNPQNYLPPIQMQDGGMMPAAYRCPHAHRALRSPLASSIGC